jgi:anion-transporting  ArsA/GET3 family ATPase
MEQLGHYAAHRMDVAAFCAESRVVIVAGKGGVGKTTVAAALARMAAEADLTALLIELEGKPGLHRAFGGQDPLDYQESQLLGGDGPGVRARRITPDAALLEYLADHGLRRISKRLVSTGVIDVVSTAIPGIRDVLVLGKVKQLERQPAADLIVVDAPATGHAVTFLTSASGLLDAARSGPLRVQAADVLEMLGDPARCRVLLVTLPEEMPVSETIEAAYQLEDRAGVQLGPVVVNCFEALPEGLNEPLPDHNGAVAGIDPATLAALESARQFSVHRHGLQTEQVARLGRELPLPQLRLPTIWTNTVGPAELGLLSAALEREVGRLAEGPPS